MLIVRMANEIPASMRRSSSSIAAKIAICFAILSSAGCGQNSVSPAPNASSPETRKSSSFGRARYDLSRDEGRGHTLKKHVGRTDEELLERLQKERDISAASTWTDRGTAEETLGQAFQAEHDKIENWERRGFPRSNLALHFDAGRVIGRSIRQGENKSTPCTSAVIVLKADGPQSFFVLTTYPEARE
jgi:hypothetical protein